MALPGLTQAAGRIEGENILTGAKCRSKRKFQCSPAAATTTTVEISMNSLLPHDSENHNRKKIAAKDRDEHSTIKMTS